MDDFSLADLSLTRLVLACLLLLVAIQWTIIQKQLYQIFYLRNEEAHQVDRKPEYGKIRSVSLIVCLLVLYQFVSRSIAFKLSKADYLITGSLFLTLLILLIYLFYFKPTKS